MKLSCLVLSAILTGSPAPNSHCRHFKSSIDILQTKAKVSEANTGPTIQQLSPTSGPVGTLVAIHGGGFTPRDNMIEFGDDHSSFIAGSPVSSEDGASLAFRVSPCPSEEPLCPSFFVRPGNYKVIVKNQNGVSNEVNFMITAR
jgi:hypothetical protein